MSSVVLLRAILKGMGREVECDVIARQLAPGTRETASPASKYSSCSVLTAPTDLPDGEYTIHLESDVFPAFRRLGQWLQRDNGQDPQVRPPQGTPPRSSVQLPKVVKASLGPQSLSRSLPALIMAQGVDPLSHRNIHLKCSKPHLQILQALKSRPPASEHPNRLRVVPAARCGPARGKMPYDDRVD